MILVFDITNRGSFENLNKWLDEIRNFASEKISIILVANKTDLQKKCAVTFEEASEYASKHDLLYFETSAKLG